MKFMANCNNVKSNGKSFNHFWAISAFAVIRLLLNSPVFIAEIL